MSRIRFNKDPVSWATHFFGLLVSIVGLASLLYATSHDPLKMVTMGFYGVSVCAVFGASSIYHFFDVGDRGNRVLRIVDHCAIFLLIGGSYTPTLVHLVDGTFRLTMLAIVFLFMLCGFIFKAFWIECPDGPSAAIYVAFAWFAVIPGWEFLPKLEVLPILWLVLGGLAFTGGAVIYVEERPDPWPGFFGHHEIWHVLVLIGAGFHYLFMWQLIGTPIPPF